MERPRMQVRTNVLRMEGRVYRLLRWRSNRFLYIYIYIALLLLSSIQSSFISECDRMRAEFASHGDLEGIDFVSLDIKVIDPDNNDTVNSYTATVGYDVNDTYEDADAEELGDFIQEFVVAP